MREPPAFWYEPHPLGVLLAPLGWLYGLFAILRRYAYRAGLRRSRQVGRPVVVVGNLCVGGTGKTPLVIAIAKLLARRGVRAGIVCRGYGGSVSRWPRQVRPDGDPDRVGDEAVLLARRAGVPVAAGPNRIAAARILVRRSKCEVILIDDGLQHLQLARDVEIVVVDGVRRHGNGRCLPAGPLREPLIRLASVDLVVVNGQPPEGEGTPGEEGARGELPPRPGAGRGGSREVEGARGGEPDMWLAAGDAVSLLDAGVARPLESFRGAPVHAVCGIGHAERFFRTLESHGITIVRHPFPDHHPFREEEIRFAGDAPVLMTEKDAVKCERFAGARHWYVPVEAVLSSAFEARLTTLLRGCGVAMEPGPQASPDPGSPPDPHSPPGRCPSPASRPPPVSSASSESRPSPEPRTPPEP